MYVVFVDSLQLFFSRGEKGPPVEIEGVAKKKKRLLPWTQKQTMSSKVTVSRRL